MKGSTPDRRGSAHGRPGRTGSTSPRSTGGGASAGGRGSAGGSGRGRGTQSRPFSPAPGSAAGAGAGRRGGRQRPGQPSEDPRRLDRPDGSRSESHRSDAYTKVRLRSPDGPLRARTDPLSDLPKQRRDDRTAMGLPARGRLSRFFADLGWRAYAIPLLIIATTLVLVDFSRSDAGSGGTNQANSSQQAVPTQPSIIADIPDAPKPTGSGAASGTPQPPPDLPSYALPAGKPFTDRGTGEFDIVPGVSQEYGTGGPLKTFTVEIESGIQGVDPAAFAAAVEKILGDPRGWGHGGKMRFQRVDSGNTDFRVSLTTPMTVRRPDFCGYSIKAETSCNNRSIDRVVINVARWTRGAVGYGNDLETYRDYAITHEVGHALGHAHQACPKAGALAPPMLQQTLGLTSANNLTCKPNPWPFPTGDTEITGPETTDSPKMN